MKPRELKFRAWSTGSKSMDGVSIIDWDRWEIYVDRGRFPQRGFKDVVLMQFTGLHDKNGKEIYEGDVVECRCELPGCEKRMPYSVTMDDVPFLRPQTAQYLNRRNLGPYIPYHLGNAGQRKLYGIQRNFHKRVSLLLQVVKVQ